MTGEREVLGCARGDIETAGSADSRKGRGGCLCSARVVMVRGDIAQEAVPMLQSYDERNADIVCCVDGVLRHRRRAGHLTARFGGTRRRRGLGGPAVVRDVSLAEMYAADEVFCTGTMGEIAGVTMIDGRPIGAGRTGALTARIARLYQEHARAHGIPLVDQPVVPDGR